MNAVPALDARAGDRLADRQALVACLHAALEALEADDYTGWRSNVDELIQWRTQPLVQGLAKLARELEQALGKSAGTSNGGGSLPEACARLEHVVRMSEEASHHTLDLIQDCRVLLGSLPHVDERDEDAATVAAIRSRFSEITAAQGYQDLTGQIIRRVVELVRTVHAGLGDVVADVRPLQVSSHGFGPSLAGIDPPATTQDDANQLLSSLGL